MNAIDLKRVEFRHYLEACGVIDALSYALIKLYDEVEKPDDAVAFVREHFKRPPDEYDAPKRIEDLNAYELMKKQEHELNLARQEIAKLQKTLNKMSSNSTRVIDMKAQDKPKPYNEIFNNPKYDGTLIKKYLTEEMFEKLYKVQVEPSIIDCIAKLDELQANPSGLFAVNGNCYSQFAALFELIIKDVHCVDKFNSKYPKCDWGDANVFEQLSNECIEFTEISCVRSLANYPFIKSGSINEQDLEFILNTVQSAIQFTRIDDKVIDGEFYKISDIKENEPIFEELQTNGIGFRSMNPQQHILWPTGRALYINCARTQSILINEQEHLRFISKELNGDFGLVYKNLTELVGKFGNGLEFERNDKFGWLTANIAVIGSGICCKVRLKLKHPTDFIDEICQKTSIKVTTIHANEEERIIELTNCHTFGVTEFECVKEFYEKIKEIIQKLAENGNMKRQHDTVDENVSEVNALCENADELNKEIIEGANNESCKAERATVQREQLTGDENDAANNEENNASNNDEKNTQNEISMISEDCNNAERVLIDENVANSPERSGENIENNTDNINSTENDHDNDEIENNEIAGNQRKKESSERINELDEPNGGDGNVPNDTKVQNVTDAKVQSIECHSDKVKVAEE